MKGSLIIVGFFVLGALCGVVSPYSIRLYYKVKTKFLTPCVR